MQSNLKHIFFSLPRAPRNQELSNYHVENHDVLYYTTCTPMHTAISAAAAAAAFQKKENNDRVRIQG
jgi:hypothetical protein